MDPVHSRVNPEKLRGSRYKNITKSDFYFYRQKAKRFYFNSSVHQTTPPQPKRLFFASCMPFEPCPALWGWQQDRTAILCSKGYLKRKVKLLIGLPDRNSILKLTLWPIP